MIGRSPSLLPWAGFFIPAPVAQGHHRGIVSPGARQNPAANRRRGVGKTDYVDGRKG